MGVDPRDLPLIDQPDALPPARPTIQYQGALSHLPGYLQLAYIVLFLGGFVALWVLGLILMGRLLSGDTLFALKLLPDEVKFWSGMGWLVIAGIAFSVTWLFLAAAFDTRIGKLAIKTAAGFAFMYSCWRIWDYLVWDEPDFAVWLATGACLFALPLFLHIFEDMMRGAIDHGRR